MQDLHTWETERAPSAAGFGITVNKFITMRAITDAEKFNFDLRRCAGVFSIPHRSRTGELFFGHQYLA